MFRRRKISKRLAKVQPGDRSTLKEFRLWQGLHRSLFYLDDAAEPQQTRTEGVAGAAGPVAPAEPTPVYAVDVHHLADELPGDLADKDAKDKRITSPAALYRDGVQVHRSDLPATFPVPGGVVDVAISMYGLTRMHYVLDDGTERTLRPDRTSLEGLRARFGRRFPRTSSVIGAVAVVVLLVGLVVAAPLALEMVTRIDLVSERFGTFTSPIDLPAWANTTLLVAGVLAATERALTLRNHWLVDLDTTGTALG
jgi:hypothetical protein